MPLQPLLHELVTCVCAPTTVLSGRDGQLRPEGAQGVFHADLRVLSGALLTVDGREAEPVQASLDGTSGARFTSLVRWLGDRGADPSVRVERRRRATGDGLTESLALRSSAGVPVAGELRLRLSADFAAIDDVKAGVQAPAAQPPEVSGPQVGWRSSSGVAVHLSAPGAVVHPGDDSVLLSWPFELPPGGELEVGWGVAVRDPGAVVARPADGAPWARPTVHADDRRLDRLVSQSLDDLDSLRLVLPGGPADQFLAAGSPWFLTLFGRDSLWAARMLLPLGTELAAGTLAALAGLQGAREDPRTEESLGKIMHELRRGSFGVADEREGRAVHLPPTYYGTVDATALWVILLHDAWRWGLDASVVAALLPHLEAAAGWVTGPADADGDGFLEYADHSGHGLSNQGWKDSGDSVRFGDGSQASGPIALAEVQGYAFEAAGCAAALLTAFDRPGADRLLSWREDLGRRFRKTFWVEDDLGAFPAMALDGGKRPVDSVTSNIGHLLGTGILDPAEAAEVAHRLAGTDMDCGYGLRTMSSGAGGFSSLSYHCGTVWPHDTAIVVSGLVREGLTDSVGSLVEGLLRASDAFDARLPELWAGDAAEGLHGPVPYPAACRPQAWSAAVGVSLVRDLLGLAPDVPAGEVTVSPLSLAPVGALSATGLRVAGQPLDVVVDGVGELVHVGPLAGLRVVGGSSAVGPPRA